MPIKEPDIGILLATVLMALNLVIGFAAATFAPPVLASAVAGGGAFLEFGILLIFGSCLLSRQPLENKDRYSEDGSVTPSWRMALLGKQMILAALILFLFTAFVALAGFVSLF